VKVAGRVRVPGDKSITHRALLSNIRQAQAALPKRSSEMAESADRIARLMIARADDEERARRPGNPR